APSRDVQLQQQGRRRLRIMEPVTGISVTAMLYLELLWQEVPESNLRDFVGHLRIFRQPVCPSWILYRSGGFEPRTRLPTINGQHRPPLAAKRKTPHALERLRGNDPSFMGLGRVELPTSRLSGRFIRT